MSLTPTCTSTTTIDLVGDIEVENVMDNDIIELERPKARKNEKAKCKAQGRPTEDIVQLS